MGEWKRIFANARLWGLLLLMAVLGMALFALSLTSLGGQETIWRMLNNIQFYSDAVEDLRSASPEERLALLEDKESRVLAFQYWHGGADEGGFSSPEEAYRSIADMPALIEAATHEDDRVYSAVVTHYWQSSFPTLRAQAGYIAGYPAYIDRIQTQARLQSQTSIFGAEGSFSRRNLEKTAADFETMRGVEATFGNDQGVETWLDFELADYLHLAGIVLFVMALLEDRKKGLWNVVRTCPNGRLRLGLHRLGILTAGSALCTVLFSLLPLFFSLSLYGGWADLGRTLQSLESFRTSTLHTTILGWLGQYVGLKIAAGLLIGLILWCVLGCVSNIQFSSGVLGLILAAEYALYNFLPVQSVWNVFKYFNLFSYVHTSTIDTQYLNVDLFGYPVGTRTMLLTALPVFGLLFALWAMYLQCFRRPDGNRDILGSAAQYINRFLDFFRARFSLGMWEAYKGLILQFGVVLLAVMVFATQDLEYRAFRQEQDLWYQAYLTDAEGPIDQGMDDYLSLARANIEYARDPSSLMSALDRLEKRVDALRRRGQEGGFAPWLVDPLIPESYYGTISVARQRFNAALAITFVAFCCAGLGAFEPHFAMTAQIRSAKRGRGALFFRKALLAVGFAVAVWAMIYLRELWDFLGREAPAVLDAPVQNLDALMRFPWPLTFRGYLTVLYGMRLVMLILTALVALCLSHCMSSLQSAYLLCVGVLGVPAFFAAFGIDALQWVSPIVPVSGAELLWGIMGGGSLLGLVPWLLYLAVSTVALVIGCRRWVRG